MASSPTSTPSPAAAPAPAPVAKQSRRGLFIVATLLVTLLLGGGAAAYWVYAGRPAAVETADAVEPDTPKGPGAAITLEPFVVNLADPGVARFLRVSVTLIVADEAQAAEIDENAVTRARIRSAILELLSEQTSVRLVTPEGKNDLKQAVAEHAAQTAAGVRITDVLFTEFVVQF